MDQVSSQNGGATPPGPVLTISVLGGASITLNGRDIPLRNRKARAMLAYLAMSDTGEEQRERLAGLFWSEFGEQNARATLRQAVHELRETLLPLGCNALVSTRNALGLEPGSFQLDLNEILQAITSRQAPAALLNQPRTAETLLAGFDDLDPSFHLWLTARRQTLQDRLVRGLEDAYRDGSLPRRQRRRLAEAALLLDPTHEEACRVVMRAAAEDGEIGAALHAYDELYRLLGDEYDMEPSAATQQLVAEVKQGRFENAEPDPADTPALSLAKEMQQALIAPQRARDPQPAPPVAPKPALFIETFSMSGVAPDRTHLVEGFRIELIACLTRFREWHVSGSLGDPADSTRDLPISGRYAVTTTAYQAGSTINVVMVLRELGSDLAIWGERFELRLDSWFETQQHIVQKIAATLNIQVFTERLMRQRHVAAFSLEAYDVWLRSQVVIHGCRVAEWNRTAQILAETIEREPGYSPLYSSLAQMNNVVAFFQPGMFRDDVKAQRTLALAQQAVALDPRDSRAELCMGWALAFCRRYSQAELHMDLACELNATDPWTLMSSAMFHAFTGDFEQAQQLSERSMDVTLFPNISHWLFLTSIRFLLEDYEGAVIAADRAPGGILTVAGWRAAALCKLGREREAKEEVEGFYTDVRAAWVGSGPPSEEAITRWLLHLYPISRVEIWERLRDGLTAAGMPTEGLSHMG